MSSIRVARVVARLWQVVKPRAHVCRAPRGLDPEAEEGREHDDGGVSMAMKLIKSRCFAVSLMWTSGLLVVYGHCHCIYGRMWVCLIPEGV